MGPRTNPGTVATSKIDIGLSTLETRKQVSSEEMLGMKARHVSQKGKGIKMKK